jgi:hypothetical protein
MTQIVNGHEVAYADHRFVCLRCRARLLQIMQFHTSECPGPAQHEPQSARTDDGAGLNEAVEWVLAEHIWDRLGRNLGQYRIEYTCDCGETFVADGHRGVTGAALHRAHVAEQIAALVAARAARAALA